MNTIFREEWNLYLKAGARPAFRGVEPTATNASFDAPVKVGEVRVFADMNRPFVALVLEDKGRLGARIVPVSPFTVPASVREILVGARVFQLWNACTAAQSFVARSWLVETLSEADVSDVNAALAAIPSGVQSEDETVLAYERAFRVAGGNFRFLAETKKARTVSWRSRAGWGLAAMLMLCCGVGGLWYEEVLRDRRVACVMQNARRMEAYRKSIEPIDDECIQDECVEEEAPQAIVCGSIAESVAEKPAALFKSPVKMRSLVGSRSPGSIGAMTRGGAWNDTGWTMEPPRPELSGERYAAASENAFVCPTDEPLSTFGLDVDTSSYTLMRSSLVDYKRLPAKDSVRIEEYVNYFKYDYPQPKGAAPVAVGCELAACPWNPEHKLLRLGVQAKRVDEAKLPPCNLTFLVDVSGSMAGEDRIELLKKSLKMLVGKLRDDDHVAIVTYANDTQVRLPSVSGREKKAIGRVIDDLVASGGTYGGAGLQLAYEEARKNFDKKANNRVILVTDGDFNIGISSPEELEKFIATKRDGGVFLTVFGVGRGNYMDDRMKKLANAGNGNYAYLDSLLEAKKVMLNEFGGTLMTVAKDVKVQIEFNPSEVGAYRLLGYENRKLAARDFNDDKKDAGEIGAGHTMTAFYEIVPAGKGAETGVDPLKYQKRAVTPSGELCTVKLRYKLPDAEKSMLVEEAHTAADMTHAEPSEDFRFASAVAEYALILKDSQHKGQASFTNLIERARNAKGADREGYRAEFIRLVERAEACER